MAKIQVRCPYCGKEEVLRYGRTKAGKQKFRCRNQACERTIFQIEYEKNAYKHGIIEKIVEICGNSCCFNGNGRNMELLSR